MVSPASTRPSRSTSVGASAVLVSRNEAFRLVEVLVEAGAALIRMPSGVIASALAVLVTLPASTSFWVMA